MTEDRVPPIVENLIQEHPDIWDAFKQLGRAAGKAGPLDAKTERLVKLAVAVGARLEGAVHSHARRGLAAGLTPAELEHVALLAITTVGWPSAVAGLSWIRDEVKISD